MKTNFAASSVSRSPARERYFSAALLFEEGKLRPFYGTGSPTPVGVPEYERGADKPGNVRVVDLGWGRRPGHMAVDPLT